MTGYDKPLIWGGSVKWSLGSGEAGMSWYRDERAERRSLRWSAH